jgi:aromatic-L-amino-acid decarboxylase
MELDPGTDERLALGRQVVEALVRWQALRAAAPIHQHIEDSQVEGMFTHPPEQGANDPGPVLERLLSAAGGGWSKAHGGDLAFIPNGGLYSGSLAALLAAGVHAFTAASFESPALIALEESVLSWFATVLRMPNDSEGVLLSGGSLANQTAIACALAAGFDSAKSTVYLSRRAHHSLHKGLRLSGLPIHCVREVPTDSATRIDLAALRTRIDHDRAAGRQPRLVIGTAGSTDTGAIDDLDGLAAIASGCGAWFHVDAAYGGMFALTERGAGRLHGMGSADSVTVDAHKGLFLPYGISALLVRHPGALERAHGATGPYQRDVTRVPRLPHYFLRGPELTRPFRGVLIWLPLHLHGVARFRVVLDRCLDLAQEAAKRIGAMPGVECVGGTDLSIVAFRAAAGDEATQAVVDAINGSGRFHVSSTTLDGRTTIRLAFLHPRTGQAELEGVLEIVRGALHAAVRSSAP